MQTLSCVELEPTRQATRTVIWLHGLGADGNDFVPLAPQLKLALGDDTRFLFPNAPSIPVTVNNGYVMPAWYDILDIQLERKVDEAQLHSSAAAIARLIDGEIEKGIDSRKIIVAGFSQGGAVAYQAALAYPKPLGCLIALSTYFATSGSLHASDANKTLAILIQHGVRDPVVPEVLGQNARDILLTRGYDVTYETYPIEHSVCPEQVSAISGWLANKRIAV